MQKGLTRLKNRIDPLNVGDSFGVGCGASTDEFSQKAIMNTLAVLLVVLCIYALAYRYYSAFLAARVLLR